jgi:MbtH protein
VTNTLWKDRPIRVVVNHEEQYSIWPLDRELPLGWKDTEKSGTYDECIAHIERVWSDMRPKSLRCAMDQEDAREVRHHDR